MAADHRQAGSLWTPEEDVILLRHVAKYGTKHWGYLQSSGVLPHRDQKACCNRFILLKRKFFQARAKGQRLTFPVVPQPEVTSELRRASSPTSTLGVSRNSGSSFKKTCQSGPAALRGLESPFLRKPEAPSASLSQENSSPVALKSRTVVAETTSHGFHAEAAMQRAADNILSPRADVTSFGQSPVLSQPRIPVLSASTTFPKPEYSAGDDGLPPLSDAPQTGVRTAVSPRPFEAKASQDLVPFSAQPHPRPLLASATWGCFNPAAAVDTGVPEVSAEDLAYPMDASRPTLGLPAVSRSSFSPDALLDQIATAPVQMLFGNRALGASGANNSGAEAFMHADNTGSIWESPGPNMDLWDAIRTATSA